MSAKVKVKGLIDMLKIFGEVELLDKNMLTYEEKGRKIYLRYSIGKTFSFVKGASPLKIQMKKGFAVSEETFKQKLDLVIFGEVSTDCMVEKLYLGNIYLVEKMSFLNEKGFLFQHKNNRLELDKEFYKICLLIDKKLVYHLKTDFMIVKDDISQTRRVVEEMSDNLDKIREFI